MTGLSESLDRPAPSLERVTTRTDLAQLVAWMLESGMYDTDDVVDAITKTEKYSDELYAATHDLDQTSFDELAEIREKAGTSSQLPDGWTAVAVSQLDTQIRCDHEEVVFDTRIDRGGAVEEAHCEAGCTATARFLFSAEPGGHANVASLPRR